MLSVSHLCAAYGGIQALHDVSIEVAGGSMVALVGANGAGKSTLLNCLSGIVRARLGTIAFQGRNIGGRSPASIARSGLLQVPEGRQILSDLSVKENLLLGSLALGNRAATWEMERILDLFPVLRERQQQNAGTLSGGEQQMLAIGRALMGAPEMLLLDEPSLGLAPRIVDQVFEVLVRLNAEGLTILLVEQNARRALSVAQHALVIEGGRIVREGPAAELREDPEVISFYLGKIDGEAR